MKRTVVGSAIQAVCAAAAVLGLFLLTGLAWTLLLAGGVGVAVGVLVETGRL